MHIGNISTPSWTFWRTPSLRFRPAEAGQSHTIKACSFPTNNIHPKIFNSEKHLAAGGGRKEEAPARRKEAPAEGGSPRNLRPFMSDSKELQGHIFVYRTVSESFGMHIHVYLYM